MAINGAHVLLYTSEPEAVRAVLRDVFGWPNVDAGGGWLIFGLPPAELGVHPVEGPAYEGGTRHQFALMCDDIVAPVAALEARGVEVRGEPREERWGLATTIALPGGLDVMLYQPSHPTAT